MSSENYLGIIIFVSAIFAFEPYILFHLIGDHLRCYLAKRSGDISVSNTELNGICNPHKYCSNDLFDKWVRGPELLYGEVNDKVKRGINYINSYSKKEK